MARFLWICLGGAAGTGARYVVSVWLLRALGPSFPFGTLAVNASGCFLLGAIMHAGLATDLLSPTLRLVLATGVMGGFTTYSTFNYETMQYLREGAWEMATLNVSTTLALGLGSGALGVATARWMVGS
jgi:CrcB protein